MNSNQPSFRSLSLAALLLAAACTTPPADPLEPAARIVSFTASKASVPRGATVTLSWKTENAASMTLAEARKGELAGATGAEGTLEVPVEDDALYVLTVANARGAVDRAVVAVRLEETAHDVLFTATPSAVDPGQPVVLAWSAPGARSVTVTDAAGAAVDLKGQTVAGSVTVTPLVTTTWTLKADTREVQATAAVRPALVEFTATPTSAKAGGTVTLAWKTSGATKVQVLAPGRAALVTETDAAKMAQGQAQDTLPAQVDPGQLFPYTLVVSAGAQELRRDVIVSVEGTPAIEAFTLPAHARTGKTFTLSWKTREADVVTLAADGQVFYRAASLAEAAANTLTLPTPSKPVAYSLIAASSRGGQVTKDVTLDVVGAPAVTLTLGAPSVVGGAMSTLSWQGSSVRGLTLSSSVEGVLHAAQGTQDTGSVQRLLNATATVTALVDNGLGETATATAQLTVTDPLRLVPSRAGAVLAGTAVELTASWDAGAAEVLGLPHGIVTTRVLDGGFDDISKTGAQVPFTAAADNEAQTVDAGFVGTLFGQAVGPAFTVTTNGTLSFTVGANGTNSSNVALPTAKLEPLTLAPLWDDLTLGTGAVYWQVKPEATGQVLVVQWDKVGSGGVHTFQARAHSSGQVDFDYLALGTGTSANCGVQGPRAGWAVPLTATPAAGTGVTFFGPLTLPATISPTFDADWVGRVTLPQGSVRVAAAIDAVIRPGQLQLSEVMVAPHAAVADGGQWVEVYNTRATPVDLAGWTLQLQDGGAVALSGTVPSRGTLVVGSTLDATLHDDAGVSLADPAFSLAPAAGALSLWRDGAASTLAWTALDAGVAVVSDFGPFRASTETASTITPHAVMCAAGTTSTYGGQTPKQRGSPGADVGCGFGYGLMEVAPGYFDISATGTAVTFTSTDSAVATIDLGAAPFPFLGAPQTSVQVTTNGIAGFGALTSYGYPSSYSPYPVTSDANSLLAIFAQDLEVKAPGGVFWKRVGANEDPSAAAPHWIIQWHHVAHYANTGKDDFNFQLKLFDTGVVEYHYGELRSGTSSQYGSGLGSVAWLENASGTQALVISAGSSGPGLTPRSAYRFYLR